ncbi:TrmH family RNA methyltransferase [Nibricoccus sp. IMCC34717]|uniref:TrmH family RNA methyltransferase n=1 Tax=Nibricoccus sp. IMCC34717 TaxID=3034021 RepID=UPI0038505DC9
MNRDEMAVCGLAAVQAVFARDPESIRRLFFDADRARRVGGMSSVLAKARKVYRLVEPAELERIAGTVHHGGIVAVVTVRPIPEVGADEPRHWAEQRQFVLALDRVGNPHNLGAIIRTAAFFGVRHVVMAESSAQAGVSEAAYRVAEGGMEHVALHRVPDLALALKSWRDRFEIFGAAVDGAMPLHRLKPAGPKERPRVLVLGNEEFGLSPEVAAVCHLKVVIPGSGRVESLNVSAAAAVLLWTLLGAVGKNLQ